MASFQTGNPYHADSDADDEFERSMTSPTQVNTDSDTDSDPPSNDHTPTTFGTPAEDGRPQTIISEWTPTECAQFVASLGLRQYCEIFLEHEIEGEALIALKHEELKEMGIASVGHRLTILKNVYELKIEHDIPIDADDYVPPSAEQNPQHEMATKDDIQRLANAVMKLREDRIGQVEAQLLKLAEDYRKLRLELLPVFKMAKEKSEPLPYRPTDQNVPPPDFQEPIMSPPITNVEGEKQNTGMARKISKKFKLTSSTPKNHSPTHLSGSTIHESKTINESGSLQPSAAANAASTSLTAGMSGGPHQSPNTGTIPSPTSPMPYHQPLAPRSYRDGTSTVPRYDGTEDTVGRMNPTPTPPLSYDSGPKSANALKAGQTTSMISSATTAVPSREMSASVPPQANSSGQGHGDRGGQGMSEDDPAVQIFKSFRVALDDPCWKVLPAALRKYHIQADWRQYALYIVYGDQERCVGLEEKPLALFKDLDREGKKPMFMLRKLANGIGDVPGSGALPTPKPNVTSSAASIRTMHDPNRVLPGGVL